VLKKLLNISKNEEDSQAALLMAQVTPSYSAREQLYTQLTDKYPQVGVFWYTRALNDLEEAMKNTDSQESQHLFAQSADFFRKAFSQLKEIDPPLAAAAIKYQAIALQKGEHPAQASQLLEELMEIYPSHWKAMEHPDEILYLHGVFSQLQDKNDQAERSLTAASEGKHFGDVALKSLGDLYYKNGQYELAEKTYLRLVASFPQSPLCGEALFLSALCSDKLQKDPSIARERRRTVFEKYPESSYAPEAYFTYYTYQDYLQGDKQAIKHLQNFVDKYPKNPFLIEAYYLIGLDSKRDRKSAAGKWIKKKNLMEAIDAFQESETLFDTCDIPLEQMHYYEAVRNQSTLERAKANLAIAEESQGAKREIYLDYAKTVFKHLVDIVKAEDQFSLAQESAYWLARTYMQQQQHPQAQKMFSQVIERYRQANVTHTYYLSRAYYELGMISLQQKDYAAALKAFQSADQLNTLLNTEQKLDLWIQESLCYSGLMQYDQAILTLSKVINDASISTLRLKAMWMRAETYEAYHRPELARKQLESLAKKGGEWASKAKEKLEKTYVY